MLNATKWINQSVLRLMAAKGYAGLREPHLNLLANLECGITKASSVAQQMGVTRQAIYRTTNELQKLGVLTLEEDPSRRNQKRIVMTKKGMQLALDARATLHDLEVELINRLGDSEFTNMRRALEEDWGEAMS